MKKKVHPKYFEIEVKCACGNVIRTRSTRKSFEVSICSACHPFYTGADEHFVDAAGRVERFQKKFAWTGDKAKKEAARPKSKASKGRKPVVRIESKARGASAPKPTASEQKAKDGEGGEAKKDASADSK
jgi:large subunit ribosomal protein L31